MAFDCRDAMHQFVEERCTSDEYKSVHPEVIWQDTCSHFQLFAGKNYIGLTKNQVKKLVYNTRNRTFGDNVISKVEAHWSGSNKTAFSIIMHHLLMKKECSGLCASRSHNY
jgi:hypothetical protein